jgi:hypothetical protein
MNTGQLMTVEPEGGGEVKKVIKKFTRQNLRDFISHIWGNPKATVELFLYLTISKES